MHKPCELQLPCELLQFDGVGLLERLLQQFDRMKLLDSVSWSAERVRECRLTMYAVTEASCLTISTSASPSGPSSSALRRFPCSKENERNRAGDSTS